MSDGTLTERERLVYSAKLAEQAERYDGASGPESLFTYGISPRTQRDRSRMGPRPRSSGRANARHDRAGALKPWRVIARLTM